MVKGVGRVQPTCCLAYSEGEKPKSALYACECGGEFQGLKAWREHMIARSMLRKRECLNAERARVGRRWGVNGRTYPSPP